MVTLTTLTDSPDYLALVQKRSQIIWPLLWLTFGSYIAFILGIAFAPQALGKPIGGGVISIGIVLGFALILFNFVITLLYVRRANHELEPLIAQLQVHAGE